MVRSLVFAFPIVPRNYTRFDAANTRSPVLERPLISLSGLSAKSATPLGVRDSWAPCTHHPWQKLPYTVTRFCLLPLFEILPCSGEQCGSLFQPARLFVEELLQAFLLTRVEAPQPEILSDSDLVSGDRLLPGCIVSQAATVDAGL